MKKIKKIASIFTLMAICASFAAGCSETEQSDVTEIVMWSKDSSAKAVMMELMEEFNNTIGKENNVKFEWVLKENSSNTEFDVAMQNGEDPDLFPIPNIQKYVEQGYVASPLDYPEFAPTVEKNNLLVNEGSNAVNGKPYVLPVSSQLFGLAYNKDMFKAAGIVDENGEAKPPSTLEEMVEDAKILTNEAEKEYGIICPGKWSGWVDFEMMYTSVGSAPTMGYDPKTGLFDYSMLKPMFQAMIDMKNNGSIYPGTEGMDNDPARARFAEGNIGMKFAVSWDIGVWNDQFPAKCDWGIAPVPGLSEDTQYYRMLNPGWTVGISKRNIEEKGAEAVALVYNYLYSDETLARLYEEGMSMPFRSEITEMADPEKIDKKGWSDFAEILKISKQNPLSMFSDISGESTLAEDFVNKVWTGEITVDQFLAERTEIQNKGIERYKELHPDVDTSARIDPDYDPDDRLIK